MTVYHRALLYITRKKGKTGLLLLILTILTTLVLMGVAIHQTADEASAQLREELGGYFKLVPDYQKVSINQWVDQALLDQIMEIKGIKAYNAMDVQYLMVDNLILEPGRFALEGDGKAQMARFLGNTSSELHEYFYLNLFALEEGRHIAPTDKGKALISKGMAEKNGLKLGDTFSAQMLEEEATLPDIRFSFEIVGIFDEGYQEGINQNTPECDMAMNFIFIDTTSSQAIKEVTKGSNNLAFRGGAVFFARDPRELEHIVTSVKELELINLESLKLTVNNSAYESRIKPLKSLERMTTLLVGLIVIIGVVLLSLLLALWERDRIHEAGVLMSFGISKWNILWQHFWECGVVFLLAFCLAVVVALPLSGKIGELLYDNTASLEEETEQVQEYNFLNDSVSLDTLEEAAAFKVQLVPSTVALSGGIGILLNGICVSAAFLVIVRRKPKELLTIME